MLSTKNTKNMKYICIMGTLKKLLERGTITEPEYKRAQAYYKQITGADIILLEA